MVLVRNANNKVEITVCIRSFICEKLDNTSIFHLRFIPICFSNTYELFKTD